MRDLAICRAPSRAGAFVATVLLTGTCATAGAAAIDGAAPSPFRPMPQPGELFELDRLDRQDPVAPVRTRNDADVDEVLRSLRVQRPRLEDDTAWFDEPPPEPMAVQVETLLRDVGADAWLNRHNDASRLEPGNHLSEVLRGLVNVRGGDETLPLTTTAPLGAAIGPGGTTGAAPAQGRSYGDTLLRTVVASIVEPYRRGDGNVGFSILGFGDFYIEVERGLRSVRLVEEESGLALRYRQPEAGPPVSARGDVARDEAPNRVVVYSDLRSLQTVQPGEIRVTSLMQSVWTWVQESLLLKFIALVWLIAMFARGLVGLGRKVRRGRLGAARASVRQAAPAAVPGGLPTPTPAAVPGGLPTPAPARSQSSKQGRRTRRRRRRSPTLRNLLRSLGLR